MPYKPDSRSDFLFVALIVPDPRRRRNLAAAIAEASPAIAREFGGQSGQGDDSKYARLGCDIAIVDLDDDIDEAVHAIESICGLNPSTTVMAWSGTSDLAVVRRAMQAGARDFLTDPLLPEKMKDAFARISTRRTFQENEPGKLLVFAPSKAGAGVTSVATNFAIALTKESGARVALVDMDLQTGDVAIGLGLSGSCSVADALRNPTRLDREFLSTLLLRHSSGLSVLSSPEDYDSSDYPAEEGANKLFSLLRAEFDYVVVDSGRCQGRVQEKLFETADKLYLVTELTFPALRNAHRFISRLSARGWAGNLEIILNRFDSPATDIDAAHVRKALGRSINWKIPNGFAAMQKARDGGVPLALKNSSVTAELFQMARSVCGKPSMPVKNSWLAGLFDWKSRPEPLRT